MNLAANENREPFDHGSTARELRAEHRLLQGLLVGVLRSADATKRCEPMAGAQLRISLPPLAAALEAHLANEERILTPILRRLETWGARRAERMRQEHALHRRGLNALTGLVRSGCEDYLLAEQAVELAQSLVREMAIEETDLFDLEPPRN